MKLPFFTFFNVYRERDVDLVINMGVIERVCKANGVEYSDIDDYIKENQDEFMIELLYQSYVEACREKYKRPKYKKGHAFIWYTKMSKEAMQELNNMLQSFFGEMNKATKKKNKKKQVSPSVS